MKLINDMVLARKLAATGLRRLQARKKLARAVATRGRLATHHFRIGVYFADSEINIYQMRQWYAPLRELSKRWPVLVLARNEEAAVRLFDESGLAVAPLRNVSDIERLLDEKPLDIILYVNQNTRNFQMMRYSDRWHVFINHGESDKMYMTSNQYKAYDYALVAGDAARSGLQRHSGSTTLTPEHCRSAGRRLTSSREPRRSSRTIEPRCCTHPHGRATAQLRATDLWHPTGRRSSGSS